MASRAALGSALEQSALQGKGTPFGEIMSTFKEATDTTVPATAVAAINKIQDIVNALETTNSTLQEKVSEFKNKTQDMSGELAEKARNSNWFMGSLIGVIIVLIITIIVISVLLAQAKKKESVKSAPADPFSPSQIMANGNQITRGKSWAETLPPGVLANQKKAASNVWRPYLSGSPTLVKAAPLSMNKVI